MPRVYDTHVIDSVLLECMYALIFFAVHGFTSTRYKVNESAPAIVDEFKLFVKGESLGLAHTPPRLPGLLRSISDTAMGECLVRLRNVA